MTSSNDPDQIRADIERTRSRLSTNVDTLAYEAKPSTMAKRQVGKVSGAVGGLRERVMGSAHDSTSSISDSAQSAIDAAQSTPSTVRRQAQGNPLAAGLIAFGAGLVVAAMIPASEKEQQVAVAVKDKAQPLQQEVADVAKEAAQNLKEPAQQAAQSVKDTATEAATTVKDEGTSATQDVQGRAQDAAHRVQKHQG
jgi:hypothetical protein